MRFPPNRLSEPTIYPKFATWLGSYDPNTIMRKIETPIFQVEKPSTETIATTFNIYGIQAHKWPGNNYVRGIYAIEYCERCFIPPHRPHVVKTENILISRFVVPFANWLAKQNCKLTSH